MITKPTLQDLNELIKIENSSFDPNNFPLNKKAFLYHIKLEHIFCIKENNEIYAYILFVQRKNSTKIRIYSLATNPNHRHKGFAKVLFSYFLEYAKEQGKKIAYLEVRKDNVDAIDLYRKLGFDICLTLNNYYDDGMDGYRMQKSL